MVTQYVFDPHLNPREIILVGLGGTGSHLARAIARMLDAMNRARINRPALHLVDPDIVEEKNVGRQMFTYGDIGQNKAEVIARRFNLALGLEITWSDHAFDPKPYKNNHYNSSTILVGAVDGHEGRKAMSAVKDMIWIDCGNHFSTGQVCIGNHLDFELVQARMHSSKEIAQERKEKVVSIPFLPNAAALFPQLLLPDTSPVLPDLSCAELVEMGEQHLLINDMVANVAAGYIFKLLYRQPIKTFLTYVDVDDLTVRSIPITKDDLAAYLPQAEVA